MRGRKPLPSKVKEVKGTERKSRKNENEPEAGVKALAWIPEELTEEARPYWNQIRTKLLNAGIINDLDREAMIMLCENWATLLEALEGLRKDGLVMKGSKGTMVRSPYLAIIHKSQETVQRLLTEFGMTPSSRTRIVAKDPDDRNKKRGFDID